MCLFNLVVNALDVGTQCKMRKRERKIGIEDKNLPTRFDGGNGPKNVVVPPHLQIEGPTKNKFP
jgi:hypothetical protein